MDIRETPSSTVKVSQDGVNLSENSENGQQVYPPKPVINTDTVSNHIDGKRYLELTSIRRSNNQLIGWHNSGADTDMTTIPLKGVVLTISNLMSVTAITKNENTVNK
jgi:hypothetical protein